jgi:hypothetical protein
MPQHLGQRRAREGEKRGIGVVEHLQDSRVKNYASSVYILEANRAAIHESLRA